jgi:hypothetical protein
MPPWLEIKLVFNGDYATDLSTYEVKLALKVRNQTYRIIKNQTCMQVSFEFKPAVKFQDQILI